MGVWDETSDLNPQKAAVASYGIEGVTPAPFQVTTDGVLTATSITLTNTSTDAEKFVFIAPTAAVAYIIGSAEKAFTITAVKALRASGGVSTGATVNVLNAGAAVLSADLSLTSEDTMLSGAGLQNTVVAQDALITFQVTGVTGTPDYITMQLEFTAV